MMDLFNDVSVIIFNLNDSLYIERCIRSCLAQTLPGRSFEIVVVTKKNQIVSKEVICNYEQYITPVFVEPGANFIEILKTGIKPTNARYVILMESDDFISDYYFLFQLVFLYDNGGYGGIAVDYWMVEPDSDRKTKRVSFLDKPILYGVMYKKELLLKQGIYKNKTEKVTAESLRLALAEQTKIGHLPISFYRRRMEPKL